MIAGKAELVHFLGVFGYAASCLGFYQAQPPAKGGPGAPGPAAGLLLPLLVLPVLACEGGELRLSASTPRSPPAVRVVEGELCRALDGDAEVVSAERARTFDEGIDYDKRIVVQLNQAADDGKPRLWVSAPVCLCVVSEAGAPVRVETEGGSEYLILVL